MRTRNIIIIVLLLVIIGMSFVIFKQRFDLRYYCDMTDIEREPQVYIMGLTESAKGLADRVGVIGSMNSWITKRLDACLAKLEAERGLEPIPVENPFKEQLGILGEPNSPFIISTPSDTNHKRFVEPENLFYEPFSERHAHKSEIDSKERPIQYIQCVLNLASLGINMNQRYSKCQIENFEKRLKRIEEYDKSSGKN